MPASEPITVKQNKSKGQIWSHARAKWLMETPEELVRQEYLCLLVNEYGFSLEQIDEEVSLPGDRGNKNARADFVVWRTVEERQAGKTALIVVECKADNVAIDRMARTSKMNMIMHGDGHGGVHHHNGLLNVNGIFEGRFHVIATNPPFGAVVQAGNKILRSDHVVTAEARARYRGEYGQLYDDAIERCLDLLAPGGRLGIVLPEGVFNNPSLQYVRAFTEDCAFLRAVVSLPQETFVSSGASVKCSILFLQKFTEKERECFERTRSTATGEITRKHQPEVDATHARIKQATAAAMAAKDKDRLAQLRKERKDFDRRMAATLAAESRALLKQRFDYPVFLYEAEKVGISATGEPDQNELFPNDRLPAGREKSCLELYREFRQDPAPFFVHGPAA